MPAAHELHGRQVPFVDPPNVPLAHAAHRRSVVALPSADTDWPATQSVHAMHAVAGLLSWSQVRGGHVCFAAVAPAQYVPTSQAVQTEGEVGVAIAVSTVPAAQAPFGTQLDWLGDDEYVPAAQVAHWRSVAEVPAALICVPTGHSVQAAHRAALVVPLNDPLAHAAHVRSAVAEPTLVT